MEIVLIILLAIIIIMVVATFFVLSKNKGHNASSIVENLEERVKTLQREHDQNSALLEERNNSITSLMVENAAFKNQIEMMEKEKVAILADKDTAIDNLQTNTEERIGEIKRAHEQQINEVKQSYLNLIAQAKEASDRQLAQAQQTANDKIKSLENAALKQNVEIETLKIEYEKRIDELNKLHAKEISENKTNYDRLHAQMRDAFIQQVQQLKQNNEEQLKKIQELNSRQVESQLQLIKDQMKTTSEEVLHQRQKELGERNIEQVSKIVDPLMEKLKSMKEAFDVSKESQQEAMARLDETIKLNTKRNESLGETADRLARALTGNVKAQGNFGELKLKQLLENMELREGEQYDTQETLRDALGRKLTGDDGKGLVPDFILHFPNNRHVVIDAKMSLTAYQRYMDAEDGTPEKETELMNHLTSVRSNVSKLAKKSYYRFLPEGYNRLDFAFMYVPIDAALNLALLNDNSLWKWAYDQGVIILGPQTMYMNLRVLEMMWTQVRQLENQQTMIDCANFIIERVQDFAVRFKDVDNSMRDVVKKMDKFNISVAPTGRSIITAAQRLVKSGGQENKNKLSLDAGGNIFIDNEPTQLIDNTLPE